MSAAVDDVPLLEDVRRRRRLRSVGIVGGAAFLGSTLALGSAVGMFDGGELLTGGVAAGIVAAGAVAAVSSTYNEAAEPLVEGMFRVDTVEGKGEGLFATAPISKGTYLFDYEGERLTEDEHFARYPNADGRYVACIDAVLPWLAPTYIDPVDADHPRSNLSRWMNHSRRRMNVIKRKQRFGRLMHMYAARDIEAGEELCFDYGDSYWTVLGIEPID